MSNKGPLDIFDVAYRFATKQYEDLMPEDNEDELDAEEKAMVKAEMAMECEQER